MTPNTPTESRPQDVPVAATTAMVLTALGIVFGDIATSPLYAFRVALAATPGTPDDVLALLSMLFWTLTLSVTVKYVGFVMRADNRGEGGIMALTSLLWDRVSARWRTLVSALGLFGAAVLYGDGALTPAVSVLSAVEGLETVAPHLADVVVPVTLAILVALFAMQRHGTGRLGAAFGPIMTVWFTVIAVLGLVQIAANPVVLRALSPLPAVHLLVHHPALAILVVDAVFLAVTGAEALYADMGHVGRRPIRLAWLFIAWPALVINYFGQGALVLADPKAAANPFFSLAPSWATLPLVLLAAVATVVASQAIITGVFSLTKQAILLGRLPRMRIIQTSSREAGQIYLPLVNWIMLAATVILVLSFRSSEALAGAYGIAVATTMVTTTVLLILLMRQGWNWPLWACAAAGLPLAVLDFGFLAANSLKVVDGGWIPLGIGLVVFWVMVQWRRGILALNGEMARRAEPLDAFVEEVGSGAITRAPGTAVLLTRTRTDVPPMLSMLARTVGVVHSQVIFLSIRTAMRPRVPAQDRLEIQDLGSGFYRVTATYGFMQVPDVPVVIRSCIKLGLPADIDEVVYFIGRERVTRAEDDSALSVVGAAVFAFLGRNATSPVDSFGLPPDRTLEVGLRIEL